MIQALYSAATAMTAQQTNIDNIANNIANLNTVGFKSSRADFADALYGQMTHTIQSQNNQLLGHGATVQALHRDLTNGAMISTGATLDMMIDGDGYFTVSDGAGGKLYTRDGAFAASEQNGTTYLTTGDGHYVLDTTGARIALPQGTDGLTVDSAGTLTQGGSVIATLGVVTFANPAGLQSVGSNRFAATAASGAQAPSAAGVLQGYQEGSNVDLAQEMTRLIRAQKAYSILARAISTADSMESTAAGIGR